MEEARILKPYELEYSDLVLLSSDNPSSVSTTEEIDRFESIKKRVMVNLGPTGPGLLSITAVPDATDLRRRLLPLARKLALLNEDDRKRILKEHGLGSDVPLRNTDRIVSPFAMQLKYVKDFCVASCKKNDLVVHNCNSEVSCSDVESCDEFKILGNTFKELGLCMMEVGHRLARICDRSIGGQELEQSLLESCSAKGRLIHYHSTLDNSILKEASERNRLTTKKHCIKNERKDLSRAEAKHLNLWQQWHYDYGVFTVLTAPMFTLPQNPNDSRENWYCSCQSCAQERTSPSGHSYLQIFDPNKNRVLLVKASSESFIVQVGEAGDILSKGKLRATLHSVCRPEDLPNLSRETFVVFLQPAWDKTFSLSNYPTERLTENSQHPEECTEVSRDDEQEPRKLFQDIGKIVPPLSARVKDGMTFAEFSKQTTRQYYGATGLQSNR